MPLPENKEQLQDVDGGSMPILYAAADPVANGGAYYGPRGFQELMGGGVTEAALPGAAKKSADRRRLWHLSEELTGVSFPAVGK